MIGTNSFISIERTYDWQYSQSYHDSSIVKLISVTSQTHVSFRIPCNWKKLIRSRRQAKFLTCYCLSVILRLKIKKLKLAITFLVCVLQI